MKILIIYGHPNPESFNHAILEAFTKGLEEGGHTFEVVDLYAMKFDPCVKLEDFAQFTGGQMPKDVLDQQEKVAQSDALAFIYPVWWLSPPAIVKGWLDRVFAHGFAYKIAETPLGVEGLLKHKKALILSTTMVSEEIYKSAGLEDAIRKIDGANLSTIAGIQQVEHIFLYSAATDDEARKRHLELAHRLGKEF